MIFLKRNVIMKIYKNHYVKIIKKYVFSQKYILLYKYMIIQPNKIYRSIVIYKKNDTNLYINRSLKGDVVAGMLAGAIIKFDTIDSLLIDNINVDNIPLTLEEYIIITRFEPSDIYKPDNGYYGWWISKNAELYYLYQFQNTDFIRGFISICQSYNVDFRDFIAGLPFKYINNEKV